MDLFSGSMIRSYSTNRVFSVDKGTWKSQTSGPPGRGIWPGGQEPAFDFSKSPHPQKTHGMKKDPMLFNRANLANYDFDLEFFAFDFAFS